MSSLLLLFRRAPCAARCELDRTSFTEPRLAVRARLCQFRMMPTDEPSDRKRPLPAAAQRALAEAAARRAERRDKSTERPREANGPGGPEPTRYGDWEINGIASDF